ncbi:MAG: DUF5106 domain-containing protein [Muribaculaceae bacterium]|nr:DUF5106 domain-containing protein [Muribaculaceae bacterium]
MKKFLLSAIILFTSFSAINAQDDVAVEQPKKLFEYPMAPDTCSTLESRCNYIVQNFWNNFDISKPITDMAGFDGAFRDYVDFFRYAHRSIVMSSIRDFMFKARVNVTNLPLIGMVAQEALYGPNAEYWSDEVYVEFARALAENTALKKELRNYYANQIGRINSCPEGQPVPDVQLTTADGKRTTLAEIPSEGFLLFFTDGSIDSSIGRTRLSTDLVMNQLADSGKVTIVQIALQPYKEGWADGMPTNWVNLCSEQVADRYDLRILPCCYILDKERRIIEKNVTVSQLKQALGQ